MSDQPWVEKHRPESWDDLQGNNKSIKQIREWITNWSPGDEPQLLVGDPGTGKTSTAFVASDELGIPINVVNLSLQRRTDELKQIARSAKTSPPDHQHQLILLDEIDNMYSNVNKQSLYDLLDDAPNPIIVTGNDEYSIPAAAKNKCNTHTFSLGVRSRKAKIKDIAEAEDIDISKAQLNSLAKRPDLRSAINDLQFIAGEKEIIGEDMRTWEEGEFSAVEALVKDDRETWRKSIGFSDQTFDSIDSAILWADQNLTLQYRGLEAGVAYEALAKADLWAGRAWERQNFRYQKFGWALLEELPEARLSESYTGYISDNMFPDWFRASKRTSDDDSPEARAYRKMKGERGYSFSASFYEFCENILPRLRSLPQEERREIASNHHLEPEDVPALGLKEEDYEEWWGGAEEGDGWSPDTNSAGDAGW